MERKIMIQSVKMSVVLPAMVGLLGAGCAQTGSAMQQPQTASELAARSEAECAGVPPREREQGLLAYKSDWTGAHPLKDEYQVGKTKLSRAGGVVIGMRAEPGLSVPWLNRVIDCHAAFVATGDPARIAAMDPFAVAGATFHVDEASTGYAVSIHSVDASTVADIEHRTDLALSGEGASGRVQVSSR